jgi:hypothetical protein
MSGGPALSFQECLITSQIDGTALANSTTATSIIPAAARFTLPSNFFWVPGKAIRVKASGRISTVVTTPGNLTLDVRFGTVATPIVVFNGGASALNVVAQTNAAWDFEATLTCRAIGAATAANMIGVAKWISRASLNAPAVGTTTGVGTVLLPDTAPVVGTGFDSTITNVVDFFATFSVANAANSIQVHQYSLESLN